MTNKKSYPDGRKAVLFAWVGDHDLKGPELSPDGSNIDKLGPVLRAVQSREFVKISLLSNYQEGNKRSDDRRAKLPRFLEFLKEHSELPVECREVKLTSPSNFPEIWNCIYRELETFREDPKNRDLRLVYHISPGTGIMAAAWILLSIIMEPTEILESSPEGGVQTAEIPIKLDRGRLYEVTRPREERIEDLVKGLPPEGREFEKIRHESRNMKKVVALARRAAILGSRILLLGETGTGKGLMAKAIHEASNRPGKFVAVNCGAIPEDTATSELFGHVKGSFTGATGERNGHILESHEGTLFLDEIGELSRDHQVRLLRAIEENKVMKLGGSEETGVDLHIIAATNRDLQEDVRTGKFREDLFYRITEAVIKIPALRERGDDINLLIDFLLDQINGNLPDHMDQEKKTLSADARSVLCDYPWPGNVREMRNVLLRAMLLTPGKSLGINEINDALNSYPGAAPTRILGRPLEKKFNLEHLLGEVVRHYIPRALKEAPTKKEAANLLGFDNYQKMDNWRDRYKGKSAGTSRSKK